jgi:GNAT superfamily N-acetyltransferase
MIYRRIHNGLESAVFREIFQEATRLSPDTIALSPAETGDWTLPDAHRYLRDNLVIGAYCEFETLAGFVVATISGPHKLEHRATLGSAYVRELHRSAGVGTGLITTALDKLRGIGVRNVLGCIVASNEASLRMVAKAGFGHIGLERRGMRVGADFVDVVHVVAYL